MEKNVIARRIDELGRVVIPIDIREQLEIKERDVLNISVKDGRIILEKSEELSDTAK